MHFFIIIKFHNNYYFYSAIMGDFTRSSGWRVRVSLGRGRGPIAM